MTKINVAKLNNSQIPRMLARTLQLILSK